MKATSGPQETRAAVEKKDVPSIMSGLQLKLDEQSGCLSLWAPEISGGFIKESSMFAE
jgi:hypothetical protein